MSTDAKSRRCSSSLVTGRKVFEGTDYVCQAVSAYSQRQIDLLKDLWDFTLPETNIFAPGKWMVGILSRRLLGPGLFSGA